MTRSGLPFLRTISMTIQPLTLIIADVNAAYRKVLSDVMVDFEDVRIVGTVGSGDMLLAHLKRKSVDLIILSMLSGSESGVDILGRILKRYPEIQVLMVSGSYTDDTDSAVKALEMGAIDVLPKPDANDTDSLREFRLRVVPILGLLKSRKTIRSFKLSDRPKAERQKAKDKTAVAVKGPSPAVEKQFPSILSKIEGIAIASSTGGPNALVEVIPSFPKDLGVPVFIVQHMPPHMTASLALSLDKKAALRVKEARQGEIVEPNNVYLAPGGKHMTIKMRKNAAANVPVRTVVLNDDPPVNSVRPAADVLFASLTEVFEGTILSIIMTGMGSDGLNGVRSMKQKRCICITQSEETCVVYGMPRAVDLQGLSDISLPLDHIAAEVVALLRGGLYPASGIK